MYSHTIHYCHEIDTSKKLHYIYQHFQDHEKVHTLDEQINTQDSDTTLYPYINNDIEYVIFEDVIGSYYLDSEIKDDFHCDQSCYGEENSQLPSIHLTPCTHTYDHISQQIHDLNSTAQQQQLHDLEEDASLFTTDTGHSCDLIYKNQQKIVLQTQTNFQKLSHITACMSTLNINTEIFLAIPKLTIMTVILVMLYLSRTNVQLFYNKNYRILIGVYTILSPPRHIKFQKIWLSKQCPMPCTFYVMLKQ